MQPRLHARRAPWVLCALLCTALPASAAQQDAAHATGFVRVFGRVSTEVTRAWTERRRGPVVLLGTGSGFVVSPDGLLVTSQHVIAGQTQSRERLGERVELVASVTRVEVLLPGPGGAPLRLDARLVAEDEENDLALLALAGAELPWLRLGDTGGLEPGAPLRALGFPAGQEVEVAREGPALPGVSESRGRVTALRRDDAGGVRYLQLDAVLNPGNSGGPVLDADGYVVGVVRMRLRDAQGLGFAVATEPLKDLLAGAGAEQVLRRRLRLGPARWLPGKRLALRLPEAASDDAPQRILVRADTDAGPGLRVERVRSPWTLAELAAALSRGELDAFATGQASSPRGDDPLQGRVDASGADGTPLAIEYLVRSVGDEALLARWIGDPDAIAFNRGLLLDSLASLQAEPLSEPEAALVPRFGPARLRGGAPPAQLPLDWLSEPLLDAACPGLPEADAALAARWPGDFRVVFRLRWWRSPGLSAPAAARNCSQLPTGLGDGSWAQPGERLGVAYAREGLFLERDGLLLLEVEAPGERAEAIRGVAAAWIGAHLARD